MSGDPRKYLYQVLEYAESIREYSTVGESEYFRSKMVQDAIIKNFMIIGEVAKRIPTEIKAELPDIPWNNFAKFRDVLIHGYDKTDLQTVWEITLKSVPNIIRVLKEYLPPPDQIKLELDT